MANLIDYPRVALKVQKVIEGTGREVSFIRNSETPVDSSKSWREYSKSLSEAMVTTWDAGQTIWDSGQTEWDLPGEPGSKVVAKAVADMQKTEELAENFNIRHGDIFFYVSTKSLGDAVDLQTYDAVIDEGKRFEIVKVEPVKPGAVNLLFIVQARR